MIYLDNAATTFPKPEQVYAAVDFCQRNIAVNIGRGSYSIASQAMKIVDETRFIMAQLVNAASPNDIVFTPSATIAANEVILGLEWDEYKTVYITPFEHNAIARPLNYVCKKYKIIVKILPFDSQTHELDIDETDRFFAMNPPDYVFLNHVSNVTGTIIPIAEIAKKAKEYDSCVIVDGSQSVGLLNVDVQTSNIDYLIFAGHKNLYASWGIGGFVKNGCVNIKPVISGGTGSDSLNLDMSDKTPVGFEAGSPNIIAISSLNASLKWFKNIGMQTIESKKACLMQQLITGLKETGVQLYLPSDVHKHTSLLSFNVPDFPANDVGEILSSEYDIAVRTGYHCAPYVHKFLKTEGNLGTVRVSIGYFNSKDDISALVRAISEI